MSVSEQPVGVHSDSDGFSDRRLSTVPWTCVLILLASHRVAVVTSREDLVPGGQSNNVYYEPSLYAHFEFPTQWVSSMSDSLLGAASCVRSSPGFVTCSGFATNCCHVFVCFCLEVMCSNAVVGVLLC